MNVGRIDTGAVQRGALGLCAAGPEHAGLLQSFLSISEITGALIGEWLGSA